MHRKSVLIAPIAFMNSAADYIKLMTWDEGGMGQKEDVVMCEFTKW